MSTLNVAPITIVTVGESGMSLDHALAVATMFNRRWGEEIVTTVWEVNDWLLSFFWRDGSEKILPRRKPSAIKFKAVPSYIREKMATRTPRTQITHSARQTTTAQLNQPTRPKTSHRPTSSKESTHGAGGRKLRAHIFCQQQQQQQRKDKGRNFNTEYRQNFAQINDPDKCNVQGGSENQSRPSSGTSSGGSTVSAAHGGDHWTKGASRVIELLDE